MPTNLQFFFNLLKWQKDRFKLGIATIALKLWRDAVVFWKEKFHFPTEFTKFWAIGKQDLT